MLAAAASTPSPWRPPPTPPPPSLTRLILGTANRVSGQADTDDPAVVSLSGGGVRVVVLLRGRRWPSWRYGYSTQYSYNYYYEYDGFWVLKDRQPTEWQLGDHTMRSICRATP
eukprot:TRINITY_DN1946_c0_g1_i1.p1 TRINITY_DN1946_c0_g1~~TRINITY_DN1946_c0_g1_i1.p1  ORF type:complete len:113 (+),score=2.64 TRINITY_DN1946_c0_g1_i1:448-786(+)